MHLLEFSWSYDGMVSMFFLYISSFTRWTQKYEKCKIFAMLVIRLLLFPCEWYKHKMLATAVLQYMPTRMSQQFWQIPIWVSCFCWTRLLLHFAAYCIALLHYILLQNNTNEEQSVSKYRYTESNIKSHKYSTNKGRMWHEIASSSKIWVRWVAPVAVVVQWCCN